MAARATAQKDQRDRAPAHVFFYGHRLLKMPRNFWPLVPIGGMTAILVALAAMVLSVVVVCLAHTHVPNVVVDDDGIRIDNHKVPWARVVTLEIGENGAKARLNDGSSVMLRGGARDMSAVLERVSLVRNTCRTPSSSRSTKRAHRASSSPVTSSSKPISLPVRAASIPGHRSSRSKIRSRQSDTHSTIR
jgi:hypothetical protein